MLAMNRRPEYTASRARALGRHRPATGGPVKATIVRHWRRADYTQVMIIGAHVLLYSRNADADRAFFRDVLGFPFVDVGGGWLIFGLPPAEAALHPLDGGDFAQRHASHELMGSVLYLMCDDLDGYIATLKA